MLQIPESQKFFIDGGWVDPAGADLLDVVNPASEQLIARIAAGSTADVERAVSAARAAFPGYARTSRAERLELFEAIIAAYRPRAEEIASLVTAEMGAPTAFARSFHAAGPLGVFEQFKELLKTYEFTRLEGNTLIVREPIGVCALITPWNAPVSAIVGKLAPALAAGCTVVVKPSEVAALSPLVLADILRQAGVPRGVFNLVNGEGGTVGQQLAAHADVDMVAFTGSTRAGVLVARAAAESIKRVQQELGGKSANIILPDADVATVVRLGVQRCFVGGGQSCQAPTRMLVHRSQQGLAMAAAKAAAEAFKVGDPLSPDTTLGPLASRAQFEKVQGLIAAGISEGATLVTGGLHRPEGLERGFYVRPTVFANVGARFRIAQEEIFGPVLSILPYDTEDEAVAIANGTQYGLAGWVWSANLDTARTVALRLRTGRVYLNGAPPDPAAPFGGYKKSGNGREGGVYGLEEYLEIKALLGSGATSAA